jgi:hypothetical protein
MEEATTDEEACDGGLAGEATSITGENELFGEETTTMEESSDDGLEGVFIVR